MIKTDRKMLNYFRSGLEDRLDYIEKQTSVFSNHEAAYLEGKEAAYSDILNWVNGLLNEDE
jgi:hypothetical protein